VFIEKAVKDAPGGVYIVLEVTTRDEVRLVAVGYRYSQKTILSLYLLKIKVKQMQEPLMK
jgi:hypothetical protein